MSSEKACTALPTQHRALYDRPVNSNIHIPIDNIDISDIFQISTPRAIRKKFRLQKFSFKSGSSFSFDLITSNARNVITIFSFSMYKVVFNKLIYFYPILRKTS